MTARPFAHESSWAESSVRATLGTNVRTGVGDGSSPITADSERVCDWPMVSMGAPAHLAETAAPERVASAWGMLVGGRTWAVRPRWRSDCSCRQITDHLPNAGHHAIFDGSRALTEGYGNSRERAAAAQYGNRLLGEGEADGQCHRDSAPASTKTKVRSRLTQAR